MWTFQNMYVFQLVVWIGVKSLLHSTKILDSYMTFFCRRRIILRTDGDHVSPIEKGKYSNLKQNIIS